MPPVYNTGPIQRLLIVHWKLAERSTGKLLSDSASESEVGEEILYYYGPSSSNDNTIHNDNNSPLGSWEEDTNNNDDLDNDPAARQAVISFAGICRALYSLPQTIQEYSSATTTATGTLFSDETSEADNDTTTHHVHLDKCSLVFVPLEGTRSDIVAIAQTKRTFGATPAAVRAVLHRSHQLFCLLRGGGIHWRLTAAAAGVDSSPTSNQQYPGMDQLFQLLKRLGRLEYLKSRRNLDLDNQEALLIQESIRNLYAKLPLVALKRDLQVHYNAFLGELSQRAAVNDCVLRSTVEQVPAPVQQPDGAHVCYSTKFILDASETEQLVQALGDFLESGTQMNARVAESWGVSLFYGGSLVSTRTKGRNVISNDTAALLMRYMSSLRYQMSSSAKNSQSSSRSSTPTRHKKSLPQIMFSYGDRPDVDISLPETHCGFLGPPPLSFLSTLDECHGFDGPYQGTRVWVLPITIPAAEMVDSEEEKNRYVGARVSLYFSGRFSFLLYLTPSDLEVEDMSCYVELFQHFIQQIVPVLQSISPEFEGSKHGQETESSPVAKWQERGCEILAIDWRSSSLYLYMDESRGVDAQNRKSQQSLKTKLTCNKDNMLMYGLDCRHFLAAHLAPDALLALEDAMEEARTHSSTHSGYPFELCTALATRWVWAYAHDVKEIYILFDAEKFITIADVQKCAKDIRDELFHNR